jgi:hypothetical protein
MNSSNCIFLLKIYSYLTTGIFIWVYEMKRKEKITNVVKVNKFALAR